MGHNLKSRCCPAKSGTLGKYAFDSCFELCYICEHNPFSTTHSPLPICRQQPADNLLASHHTTLLLSLPTSHTPFIRFSLATFTSTSLIIFSVWPGISRSHLTPLAILLIKLQAVLNHPTIGECPVSSAHTEKCSLLVTFSDNAGSLAYYPCTTQTSHLPNLLRPAPTRHIQQASACSCNSAATLNAH